MMEAHRYLQARGITPGASVHCVPAPGTSYEATYLGLLSTEHDLVCVVRAEGAEHDELRMIHYSKLLKR